VCKHLPKIDVENWEVYQQTLPVAACPVSGVNGYFIPFMPLNLINPHPNLAVKGFGGSGFAAGVRRMNQGNGQGQTYGQH
jgi:hypothetical protein